MPLFGGVAVENKEDVDSLTKVRIRNLFGNIDEEFKFHRLALFALAVMAAPQLASKEEKKEASEIFKQARDLYAKVNTFVDEGRRFKNENFPD